MVYTKGLLLGGKGLIFNLNQKTKVINMYLSKEKAERVVDLMSSFAMWSDTSYHGDKYTRGTNSKNHVYAVKRQAEIILEIISLGFSHPLEGWAKDVMASKRFTTAEYKWA